MPPRHSIAEIARVFLGLGCMSFGGAIAHIGYLHGEFVAKRKWLDEAEFSDLVALCNFLPGPASSQLVFAIGMRQAGLAGALAASIAFLLPSAVLMILFGYGLSLLGDVAHAGWLHGLMLAAVAVVAQAVWLMARRLCPDAPRIALMLAAAFVAWGLPGAKGQIGAMVGGATIGWLLYGRKSRAEAQGRAETPEKFIVRHHAWAAMALTVFLALLVILPLLAQAGDSRALRLFAGIYRAGALVFGGGHVVLPLLQAVVVPPGWMSNDAFLAGYGAAQALPGPLFSFAGYLGTVIFAGPRAWLGGLMCLLAIYLPAWLAIGGALPFWHTLRAKAWAQAALRGTNAAVVGLLLAAFYNPVCAQGIRDWRDGAVAAIAFVLLEVFRVPPWAIVLGATAAGQWL